MERTYYVAAYSGPKTNKIITLLEEAVAIAVREPQGFISVDLVDGAVGHLQRQRPAVADPTGPRLRPSRNRSTRAAPTSPALCAARRPTG